MKSSSPILSLSIRIPAKPQQRQRLKLHALAVAAAFSSTVIAPGALANPTGPQVVAGQATVNAAGANLTVTNTAGAVLNWQSFSIGAKETTKFVQPNAQSAVLNRVVGINGAVDPSVIAGQLQSNGKVFLINPQGIVFGAGSKVDVGGLVASTLDISNQDFQAGRINLKAGPNGAGVVKVDAGANIATPTGGQVYLVGKDVSNSGIIRTPQGQVILAAGSEVQILDTSTPGVRVVFKADNNKAENLGEISAGSGQVGLYGAALRNKGIINADQISRDAQGRIVLKATKSVTLESGSTITANGAQGGTISITADGVAGQQAIKVEGNTLTSANGQAGAGGVVTLRAAAGLINVDQGAIITANGAPGGTVLIQANQGRATVSGEVSARGIAPVQTTLFKPAASQISVSGGDVVVGTMPSSSETVAPVAASHAIGGTVHVLGVEVGVYGSGALIDASGPAGGGTVLVGGDFQGKNASVQNARGTYFGADATIKADATLTGAGGTVIVWADVSTHAHGSIDVRGGASGGNGGFVETSGKEYLLATRAPLINARHSQSVHGQWLLDPDDLTISAAGDSGLVGTPPTYTSGGAPSNLSVATLNAALDAGGNVTATAGNAITVAANITKSTGADSTLVLSAGNGVAISGGVAISSSSNKLNFTAYGGATGGVSFLTGASLNTNNGDVLLVGNSNTTEGVRIDGANITAGTGTITMSGVTTVVAAAHGVEIKGGSQITGATITLNGTGNANFTAASQGVNIDGATTLVESTGAMTIVGVANASSNSHGVFVQNATLRATGSGLLSVSGSAATGSGNHGVFLLGNALIQASGTGALTVQGSAHATATNSDGVRVGGSSTIGINNVGSTALLTVSGYGGDGTGGGNSGVSVLTTGTVSHQGSGGVSLIGNIGNGSGANSTGVLVDGSGAVNSSGNLTINGQTSANAAAGRHGVKLGTSSVVQAQNGQLLLVGSSFGTGVGNHGIYITGAAQAIALGTGTISAQGSGAQIANGGYNIFIDSTAPSALSSAGQNIALAAQTMNIAGNINAGSGRVTLKPLVTTTPIDLGGADSPAGLGLTSAELNRVTAGVLQIGSAGYSGGITITTAIGPTGTSTLNLNNPGGTITQTTGSLTINSLHVDGLIVNLGSTSNSIQNLAARAQGAGGAALQVGSSANLFLTTVDSMSNVEHVSAHTGNITVLSGASVSQSGTGNILTNGGRLTATISSGPGAVTLTNAGNAVSRLYGSTQGGNFTFSNGGSFTVGDAAAVASSINTSGGSVTISALSGNVTLAAAPGSNTINSQSGIGQVVLNATGGSINVDGGISVPGTGSIGLNALTSITVTRGIATSGAGSVLLTATSAGGAISITGANGTINTATGGGAVQLAGDNIAISTGATVDAGVAGTVTLKPYDPTRQITVGPMLGVGLVLTNATLAAIAAPQGLYLGGASQTGDITFDGAVIPLATTNALFVHQAAGGAGAINFSGPSATILALSGANADFDAGMGGITQLPSVATAINGAGIVKLNTTGSIGSVAQALKFGATAPTSVVVGNSIMPLNVYVSGVNDLTMGAIQNRGELFVAANGNVTLAGAVVMQTTTGSGLFRADFDNNGIGTLTVQQPISTLSSAHVFDGTGSLTANNPALVFIGADMVINNTVTAALNGDISVRPSGIGRTIGLGSAVGANFTLDNAEIAQFSLSSSLPEGGQFIIGAASATSGAMTMDAANFGSRKVTLISQSTIDDTAAGQGASTSGQINILASGVIGGASGGGDGLTLGTPELRVSGSGGNNITIKASGVTNLTVRALKTGGGGNIALSSLTSIILNGRAGFLGESIGTTGALSISSAGSISQIAANISATTLATTSVGGTMINGITATNNFLSYSGSNTGAGGIAVVDSVASLNVGAITNAGAGSISLENKSGGLILTGAISNPGGLVSLLATGSINESTGSITALDLFAQTRNNTAAAIFLTGANDVTNVALRTMNAAADAVVAAPIHFTDINGYSIGVASASTGIATLGNINLSAGAGTVSQTLPIQGATLILSGGTTSFTLNDTFNHLTSLQGSSGPLQFTDRDALTIGALTVTGAATITSVTSGNIDFTGGAFTSNNSNLTINTGGLTTLANITGVATLTTDAPGTVQLGGSIGATTMNILESTGLSLCGSVGSAGTAFSILGPVTLCGPTTITGISITFNSTVNSATGFNHSLSVNSPGTTSFLGAVGATQALGSLSSDLGGSTVLQAGANTTGAITVMDIANLGGTFNSVGFNTQNAVLTDATTVNAGSGQASFGLLNGGHALTVNSSGNTVFSLAVGGTTPLTSLTTDAAGATLVHNNITSGTITFNDATSLRGVTNSATFAANGGLSVGTTASATINAGAITIAGGLNGNGGTFGLVLNSTGLTSITGGIGGTTMLPSITTNAGGTTSVTGNINVGALILGDAFSFQGGTVTSLGVQFYTGLNLLGASSFTSGSGFNNSATLNANGNNLVITTATPFQVIGPNFLNVNQFTAGGAGGLHLSGAFTTIGNQTYNTPLTLFANSSLSGGAASAIAFNGPVSGAFSLGVNGGTISQTAPISVSTLNLTGASGIGLTNAANSFGAFSATSGGVIGINASSATLTVNGISATGAGNVVIANTGSIVNNGPINVGTGTFTEVATGTLINNGSTTSGGAALLSGLGLTLGGGSNINSGSGLTLNSGTGLLTTAGSVSTGNTPLALIADELALGGTLTAGTGTVVIDSSTAARTITLGAPGAGTLSISNAALGAINSASKLQIGSSTVHTGALRVNSAVTTARPELLLLTKGGAIDINAGINVTGGTLTVNAGTGNFAVSPAAAAGALAINANNVFFNGGNVSFNAGSALNQSVAVNAANNLTVFSTGGINVLGGGGAGSSAALIAANNVTLNSTGALVVQGGSGAGAFAKVDPAFVEVTAGSVQLKGGGIGAYSQIAADVVNVQATAGNVTLEGGTGAGASASIEAKNGGTTLTTLASGQINLVSGTGTDSDAVVLATKSALIQTGTCTGCVILTTAPASNGITETGVRGNPTVLNNLIFNVVNGVVISQSLADLTDRETRALIRLLNSDLDSVRVTGNRSEPGTQSRPPSGQGSAQSDNEGFESAIEGGTPTRSRTGSGQVVQSCSR